MKIPRMRQHKGSGQALIEFQGKRHYLGKFGSPEADEAYGQFLRRLLDQSDRGSPATARVKHTIADFLEAFLDWALAYYRDPSGAQTNEYAMLRYAVTPALEHCPTLPVCDFSPVHFKAVRQRMIDQGWSRKYVNHQAQRLRRAFRWGVENGFVPAAVLTEIVAVAPLRRNRTSARETLPVGPIDDRHVDLVLPHLSRTVAAMVQLQRRSGMRPQNTCLLTPGQIDRSQEVWAYKPKRHKTSHVDRELEILFGPQSQAVLIPLLFGLQDDDYVFSPKRSVEEYRDRRRSTPRNSIEIRVNDARTRARGPGDKYNARSYRRAILYGIFKANTAIASHLAEQLGREPTTEELAPHLIPHWHPHQLRHSRATEIRSQYGLEAAQVALGHSKANVTEIYAKRDRELAEKVARETG